MEINVLKDHVKGLEASQTQLRKDKDLFVESQGLAKQEAHAQGEIEELDKELEETKDKITPLRVQKAQSMRSTSVALADKMSEVLPHGVAVLEIEDKDVYIGWDNTPYNALSGGEKATYDAALCKALGANVLIVEAAELDRNNLDAQLDKLVALKDVQVLVCTCHGSGSTEGWFVVDL